MKGVINTFLFKHIILPLYSGGQHNHGTCVTVKRTCRHQFSSKDLAYQQVSLPTELYHWPFSFKINFKSEYYILCLLNFICNHSQCSNDLKT